MQVDRAKREVWLDCWKGILIILVVLGHLSGGAYHLAHGESQVILQYIFKLIYTFHMPAFFFISGYTYREGENWYHKKIQRLIVPYFVFGVISVLLYWVMQDGVKSLFLKAESTAFYSDHIGVRGICGCLLSLVHGGGWPNGEGFRYNSVLWFLPCMFVGLLAFKPVARRGVVGVSVFMFVCVIAKICFALPGNLPWGVSLVPWYCIFICLGWFAKRYSIFNCGESGYRRIMLLIGMIFLYGIAAYLLPNPSHLRQHSAGRLLLLLIAIGGCYVSGQIAKAVRGTWIAYIGMSSLGIMLTHKFLVVLIQTKIRCFRSLMDMSPLMAVLGVVLITVLITFTCIVLIWPIRRWMPWALGEFKYESAAAPSERDKEKKD